MLQLSAPTECRAPRASRRLNPLSRVRLAVHYPSDVVAGQLVAAGTAFGVAGLL